MISKDLIAFTPRFGEIKTWNDPTKGIKIDSFDSYYKDYLPNDRWIVHIYTTSYNGAIHPTLHIVDNCGDVSQWSTYNFKIVGCCGIAGIGNFGEKCSKCKYKCPKDNKVNETLPDFVIKYIKRVYNDESNTIRSIIDFYKTDVKNIIEKQREKMNKLFEKKIPVMIYF